jgi:hypothetical protein
LPSLRCPPAQHGNAATADQTKIQNIETIDTDDGSANQITVHLTDVLHIDPSIG